jgi:hypothetical protein
VKQDEHNEQVMLFAWARVMESQRPELELLFAVPNGGRRDAVTGARLKAEGVKAGVPDVWLPVARGGYHGLVIELKANVKGRATREQVEWMRRLEEQGYYVALACGGEAARKLIMSYLAMGC